MGRLYIANAPGEAIAAAGDMLELLVAADNAVKIHRLWVEQNTEAGDSESEQVSVSLNRVTGAPTSGSGGTTVNAQPIEAGGAADACTIEANNTTDLTGGTTTELMRRSFNVMNGLEIVFTPEERPTFTGQTRFLLKLETTTADSVTYDYGVIFEEIG